MTKELGIQSYCYRVYQDLESLADALEQSGLKAVEMWRGHLPFDSDAETIRHAVTYLAGRGIKFSSYGAVTITEDEEQARQVLELAKIIGVKAVTMKVKHEAYTMLEKLLEEYDLYCAMHNHGRNHIYGTMAKLDAMIAQTSPRFGVCLDTAWMLDAGEDPLEAARHFADRLYGVHLKDFLFDADEKPHDVIIGQGKLDLPGFMRVLQDIDFSGYLSIEYEGVEEDPIPNTVKCVEAVQIAVDAL
jgi:sugar phosphate isomerase/epimerase